MWTFAAARTFDIPPGIAALGCSLVAALAALITTILNRPRKGADDDEVAKLAIEALLASMRRQEADSDEDGDTKEEQGDLVKHLRTELEQKHRHRGDR